MDDDALVSIRTRLVEIDDELRSLPDTDFAGKHKLNVEADVLRQQLEDNSDSDAETTLARWADRSARKNTHTPDEELEKAKAALIQSGEGGT